MEEKMETLVYPKSTTWHLTRPAQVRKPAAIEAIRFASEMMQVFFEDGRTLSVPLDWFPELEIASQSQRDDFQIHGEGMVVSWPEIGLQVTTRDLLAGTDPCEQCWFRVSYFK
jgi:hypothetical protein